MGTPLTKTTTDERKKVRAEILKAAAPFLKVHGTHGAPVDQIMKAAGLTSGALYSHFKNKEDLCAQAICDSLDALLERYRPLVRERGKEGLKAITTEYLSEGHVGAVARGCTFAALGADMGKASPSVKRAYEVRVRALLDVFAEGLQAGTPKEKRAKAQLILSAMVGAMTVVRAMNDGETINEFLSQVRAKLHREIE